MRAQRQSESQGVAGKTAEIDAQLQVSAARFFVSHLYSFVTRVVVQITTLVCFCFALFQQCRAAVLKVDVDRARCELEAIRFDIFPYCSRRFKMLIIFVVVCCLLFVKFAA